MSDIVWGSIGCGDVMEIKSGPAFQNVPGSGLGAVMRRNIELAKDFAMRHGVPKWYGNAQELVDDPEINAVYIATPPDSHLQYTILAAEAGKPIYVEKPMANSFAECQEMIQVCQSNQVPLFVAYYRRALPRYLKVKEIIESGRLGSIHEVKVNLLHPAKSGDIAGKYNWRVIPEIAGCGYFCDLGSHIFDLLQYLLGPIKMAKGMVSNTGAHYAAEDTVEVDFQFDNLINGKAYFNFNSNTFIDKTEIIGTNGSISYSHFHGDMVELSEDSSIQRFEMPNPRHIQQDLIQLIVDELKGLGHCPSTGETGAETNRILDQILGY